MVQKFLAKRPMHAINSCRGGEALYGLARGKPRENLVSGSTALLPQTFGLSLSKGDNVSRFAISCRGREKLAGYAVTRVASECPLLPLTLKFCSCPIWVLTNAF